MFATCDDDSGRSNGAGRVGALRVDRIPRNQEYGQRALLRFVAPRGFENLQDLGGESHPTPRRPPTAALPSISPVRRWWKTHLDAENAAVGGFAQRADGVRLGRRRQASASCGGKGRMENRDRFAASYRSRRRDRRGRARDRTQRRAAGFNILVAKRRNRSAWSGSSGPGGFGIVVCRFDGNE